MHATRLVCLASSKNNIHSSSRPVSTYNTSLVKSSAHVYYHMVEVQGRSGMSRGNERKSSAETLDLLKDYNAD